VTKFFKSVSYAAGFYGRDFESLIDFAGNHGVPAVQLIPDQFPNLYSELDASRMVRLRHRLKENNVRASLHNVFYDINICSLVPEVQQFALKVTEKVARLANGLGAHLVTVHPGYMYPGWRYDPIQNASFWGSAKMAIESLNSLGEKYGITFLLENGSYCLSSRLSERRQDFHLGIDINELGSLLVFGGSNMAICMDYGKLLASGVDPLAFASNFLGSIRQVQVSTIAQYYDSQLILSNSAIDEIEVVFEGKDQDDLTEFLKA